MIKQLLEKIKTFFKKEEKPVELMDWQSTFSWDDFDKPKIKKIVVKKKKPNETKQTRSKKQPSQQPKRKEKSGNKQTKK